MQLSGGSFCLQSGLFRFQLGIALGNGTGSFGGFRLAALQDLQILPGLRQLTGKDLQLSPLGGIALPVGGFPLAQGILLPAGGLHSIQHSLQQDLMLLFQTLEPQHLIFRFPKLTACGGQLEVHLVHKALGLLNLGLQSQVFLLQLFFLGGELFQLIGPGENTGIFVHRTAGHGAAGIHHLTVQSDDAEAAMILSGHLDGRIQVGSDHCLAQLIVYDIPIGVLGLHQIGSDAYEATAGFQAGFLQTFALHGVHRQECGAAVAGAL